MNATFPPRLPFEVFDGVGDVAGISVNSRLRECAIKKPAGRSDERMALLVFLISRLLANQKILADDLPSPKTVCVAFFHKGHALQYRARFRTVSRSLLTEAKPSEESPAFSLFKGTVRTSHHDPV